MLPLGFGGQISLGTEIFGGLIAGGGILSRVHFPLEIFRLVLYFSVAFVRGIFAVCFSPDISILIFLCFITNIILMKIACLMYCINRLKHENFGKIIRQ